MTFGQILIIYTLQACRSTRQEGAEAAGNDAAASMHDTTGSREMWRFRGRRAMEKLK